MSLAQHFSASYSLARAAFIDAARSAGAVIDAIENTNASGPQDERLFCDVARLGAAKAEQVLFINSGTHGVEGYCGSGCQIALLYSPLIEIMRKRGIALVLSHALNPYGFAHDRRVCEGNVDLNRNFVDHGAPPKDAPRFAELHAWLTPGDWGKAKRAADVALAAWIDQHGFDAYQRAVTGGQYTYADGVFFGGSAPTWSNRTWRRIIAQQADGAQRVVLIDLHTGLGPNGRGECIYIGGADEPGYARARAWWPDVTSTAAGSSSSAPVSGSLLRALDDAAEHITAIALEFGTTPIERMLEAVRADNWHYLEDHAASPTFAAAKRDIRAAFYDESPAWKNAVAERALTVVEAAIVGLAQAQGDHNGRSTSPHDR